MNSLICMAFLFAAAGNPEGVCAQSESVDLYVDATYGDDDGDGSQGAPFATLAAALSGAGSLGSESQPVVVNAGEGEFAGAIVVPAFVTLRGSGSGSSMAKQTTSITVIQATGVPVVVTLQENAGLSDVVVSSPAAAGEAVVLVEASDVSFSIERVVLDGGGNIESTGLFVQGPATLGSLVAFNEFRDLQNAVLSENASPTILRNDIHDILGDAVLVNMGESTKQTGLTPNMGDAVKADSGFNFFVNIGGLYVGNLSEPLTTAQFNFWDGHQEEELVALKMEGNIQFTPFNRKRLIPATLTGFLTAASSGDPVPASANPTVTAGLAVFEIAESEGLYAFANLPDGVTEVTAAAEGFDPQTQSVTITEGEAHSLDFDLVSAEGEGEGEGEECRASSSGTRGAAGRGDAIILAIAGLLLTGLTLTRDLGVAPGLVPGVNRSRDALR